MFCTIFGVLPELHSEKHPQINNIYILQYNTLLLKSELFAHVMNACSFMVAQRLCGTLSGCCLTSSKQYYSYIYNRDHKNKLTNNKSCRYSETLGQGHRPQANESIMDIIVNVCLPTDHQRPLRTTYCSSGADWCKLPWTRQKREIVKTLGSRKPSVLRSSCVLCAKNMCYFCTTGSEEFFW